MRRITSNVFLPATSCLGETLSQARAVYSPYEEAVRSRRKESIIPRRLEPVHFCVQGKRAHSRHLITLRLGQTPLKSLTHGITGSLDAAVRRLSTNAARKVRMFPRKVTLPCVLLRVDGYSEYVLYLAGLARHLHRPCLNL